MKDVFNLRGGREEEWSRIAPRLRPKTIEIPSKDGWWVRFATPDLLTNRQTLVWLHLVATKRPATE